MVKLHQTETDKSIPVRELKDGQIGVITLWDNENNGEPVGRIVQRFRHELVLIGLPYGKGYSIISKHDTERVRVLEKGELIEIC